MASPLSSSADSQSPHMPTSDLTLDPADPLNFLLMDESGAAPWPEPQMKPFGTMDFSDLSSLSMDIDYMNALAVEPSALQYNNNFNPHYGFDAHPASYVDDFSATQFPFTFQVHHDPSSPSDSSSMQSSSSSSGRRLSISSSVSSLSPAPESQPSMPSQPPAVEQPIANDTSSPVSDAAALLAERVRQSAGVMLALPMTAQLQAFENQQTENTAPTNPSTMPKLPIPRLPRHLTQPIPPASASAASSPPPSTPSPPSGPQPRSKTSHTTIERRYRTNLNARIQSLRMAVPALRVVDDGAKKRAPNKVLVSGEYTRTGADVVDARGFVDGVRVARKCSKANVLGKAVEYIRVLKRREARLRNEQAGLKSLVAGLVGGPALLREWEREWREMFGGEEKDEIEGEGEPEADDDDDDDDEEDEEEGGRKRKRGKTSTTAASAGAPQVKAEKKEKKVVLNPDGTVPEKRKRGRPRKVVPPPPPQPPTVSTAQPVQGPQQYLLAAFALFSFFNSPLTSAPPPMHVHTGTVLSGSGSAVPPTGGWGLAYCLQLFHLLVSIIVLLRCISSWAGLTLRAPPRARSSAVFTALKPKPKDNESRTPADWVRLGESYVFARASPTLLARLQAYHHISSLTTASASDLCTAALVLYGCPAPLGRLARARARAVWNSVRARGGAGPGEALYERLVLEGMSVDEAAARLCDCAADLRRASEDDDGDGDGDGERWTPMRVLGASLVRERVRVHLGVLFVGSVCASEGLGGAEGAEGEEGEGEGEEELVQRGRTVEAAKELGGRVGALGRRLERVWRVPMGCELREEEGEGDEVEALVDAVVLYRKVFVGAGAGCAQRVTAPPSPPPSPGRRDGDGDVGRLRRALGCRVFEESGRGMEDARDRAVDRVVELERSSRGVGVGLN